LPIPPNRLPEYRQNLTKCFGQIFQYFISFFYEWANKYNLKDEWLLRHFFEVLIFWVNNPKVKGKYLGGFFIPLVFFVVQDYWEITDGTKMRFNF
jgi:hypothetical protein